MITRSKAGIFKPKIYTSQITLPLAHIEPDSVEKAMTIKEWKEAMDEECAVLIKNQTWSLVPYSPEMNIVDNKWVFRVKYNQDGSVQRHKARLVAKGFQQTPGLDYFETFSPVVKPSTIRVIFTLAITHHWDIQQVDINNAFLNGELQEEVFMK